MRGWKIYLLKPYRNKTQRVKNSRGSCHDDERFLKRICAQNKFQSHASYGVNKIQINNLLKAAYKY